MKRFLRTPAGKTCLWILINLCALLVAGCVLCAFLAYEQELYGHTREECDHAYIADNLRNVAWQIVMNEERHIHYVLPRGLGYLYTESSGTIRSTQNVPGDENAPRYAYGVTLDNDGNIMEIYELTTEQPVPEERRITLYPLEDFDFGMGLVFLRILYTLRWAVYPLGLAALLLAVCGWVILLNVAGRRPGEDGLFPGPLHVIPLDILLLAYGAAGWLILAFLADRYYAWGGAVYVAAISLGLLALNLLVALSVQLAVRIKAGHPGRNTVLYRLGRGAVYLLRQLPLLWRTAVLAAVISLAELLAILAFSGYWNGPAPLLVFWLVEKLILIPALLYTVLALRRLQTAGRKLAAGDLAYRTDTTRLFWALREHGENLNRISDGMARAVEERIKSERMKTELITNVSHDIKTPLTSVINYTTLVAREAKENPQLAEYSEVLLRQSEKLRKLTDDLVEASKAASGSLEVALAPCDPSVLLAQAAGEYEEKLREAGLTLVTRLPEEELTIQADSRRMWRVFENLMNNIVKYALPGTRVFLTLEARADAAVITFRNTSREALAASAEELLERFVRGDASRHTEGNGLGLSIARSLTELQGGTLELTVDGDLFKVALRFPKT